MADGSKVLKEFLVKIGFKVDETKFRRFQEVMHVTAKNAVEMGKTALAATTVMTTSLRAAAQQMEGLYFSTRRTGASAGELKSLAFAAEQVGVSADQARAAVEGLASSRRMNPGLNGILSGMGIDPRQTDNAKVLVELVGKLRSMPFYQGAQVASLFGINEQTLLMLEQGLPEMQKYLALREKMFGAAGINPADMANRSHEFMTHFRTMEAAVGNLADIVAYRLMPWGEKLIDWVTDLVMWFTRADRATDGWSSKLVGLASALAGGSLLKGGFGLIAKLLGRGGVAAAGEEGAAAAGGIPLAGVAALGGLGYLTVSKGAATKLQHALGMKDRYTADDVKGWLQSAMDKTGLSSIASGLAGWVAGFEGHAKNGYGVYRDIAGHATAGFGHLVQPGEHLENLDKQGALALLAKDLAKARTAVLKWVHVKLTQNQLAALTDFEFNVGEGKFAGSTLLRKLNAGNYSGAGNEFERWNHAFVDGHLQTVAGLTARRAAEAARYRTPDRPIQLTQRNEYHIVSTDPRGAAAEVEQRQKRANADLVRNFATAVK